MAKHVIQYPLNHLDIEQFAILIMEAGMALKWQLGSTRGGFTLTVPPSAWSKGETLVILVDDKVVNIESKNSQWQFGGAKKNEKNLTALTEKLDEVRAMYTPEQLTEKYNVIAAEQEAYQEDLEERIKTNNLTADEKIALQVGGMYITYALIAVNLLIFIMMVVGGAGFMDFTVESLYKWGGNVRSLTANGEWYRLITNIFLHAGLVHVALNMVALFFVGRYLEPILGRWRYLAAYLACGVFASLTSIWWSDDRISVGASGAIFGLYGVFLALLTTNLIDKDVRKPMLQSIIFFVIYNIAYGTKGGIDNSAHVGGLLSGVAIGYLYYFIFNKGQDNAAAFAAVLVVITVAGVYTLLPVISRRPMSELTRYSNSLKRFDDLQNKAIEPIKKLNDTSFSPVLGEEFKTVALPAWLECKAILDSADTYKLQDEFVSRKNMLKRYVDLRIKSTELYIKQESEKTGAYANEIETTNIALQNVLDTLNKQ